MCVSNGRFLAGYDWDSLVFVGGRGRRAQRRCLYPGLAAAAGCARRRGRSCAAVEAVIEAARITFEAAERHAVNAVAWVRCYNARCQIDNQVRRARATPDGSFIEQLAIESSRN